MINLQPLRTIHAARFLAKRGVNVVRIMDNIASRAKNPRLTESDLKIIDRIWRVVAAMKKEGIYLLWDPLESTCRHASLSIL